MSAVSPVPSATFHSPRTSDATGSEGALVERCRGGDVLAFDQLVETHQERVFNLCYWMLGNRDDAADAAQEAFVRAYRSLDAFRGESTFGTWLHRIAVNTSLDSLQRRKRMPLPYTDLEPERGAADSEGTASRLAETAGPEGTIGSDPARLCAQHERRQAVREALAALPDHYRLALVLFDIEGHTYEEIAQSLHLPLGTVKSRINRARLALRERLQSVRELFEA
jgi:RNA polymerase sigma-70 factor (ECF subfamily)